jgi:hypothetical protein
MRLMENENGGSRGVTLREFESNADPAVRVGEGNDE